MLYDASLVTLSSDSPGNFRIALFLAAWLMRGVGVAILGLCPGRPRLALGREALEWFDQKRGALRLACSLGLAGLCAASLGAVGHFTQSVKFHAGRR